MILFRRFTREYLCPQRRHASVIVVSGIVTSLLLVACNGAGSYRVSTSWRHLHVGAKVYIGMGGKLGDMAQAVCPSLAAYFAWVDTGRLARCLPVRHGTPAIVEAIIPSKKSDPDSMWGTTHVELRAVDKSWHGYTAEGDLQPDIPIGAILLMDRDWGAPLNLAPSSDSTKGPDLGPQVAVKVLRYDPWLKSRTLYVKVLDGAYKDREGWMGMENVESSGLGIYGLSN